MKIQIADRITLDSTVDGIGLRAVIWTQGCKHNCEGCHNPSTHEFNKGYIGDCDVIIEYILANQKTRNVTFSGGDPFEQPLECACIAKKLKHYGFNIWAYTGYTFEQLIKNDVNLEFLKYVDVLVDGPFILSKRDISLAFKGSDNQRILDVCSSLKHSKAVLYER